MFNPEYSRRDEGFSDQEVLEDGDDWPLVPGIEIDERYLVKANSLINQIQYKLAHGQISTYSMINDLQEVKIALEVGEARCERFHRQREKPYHLQPQKELAG